MQKLMYAFILLGGLIYLSPSEVMAQTVRTTEVNTKTQEKVEKAKVKLQQNKEDHENAIEKLSKLRADFEKKHSAGKLSPNSVEKMTNKIQKQSKSIEKFEKKMDKLEEYILKNS